MLCLTLALAGCGGEGHPPTARIELAPRYLSLDDGHRTDVVLDGAASRDAIDDPQGARPLRYRWEIDDPFTHIVEGGLDRARVVVRLAARRPTSLRLTVTDGDGDSARSEARIGVTVP